MLKEKLKALFTKKRQEKIEKKDMNEFVLPLSLRRSSMKPIFPVPSLSLMPKNHNFIIMDPRGDMIDVCMIEKWQVYKRYALGKLKLGDIQKACRLLRDAGLFEQVVCINTPELSADEDEKERVTISGDNNGN